MELLRPKNQQITIMPRPSKPNLAICKKHPKHQQSPGVCSICLSEKLFQLTKNTSRSKKTRVVAAASSCSSSSLSSSPSQCSSCASSACSSPVYGRMASDIRGSSLFSRAKGRNELIKSRSMAAVVTRRIREKEAGMDRHRKKKTNFWSKLLRPRGKRIEEAGLVHSRTMREMLATTAH